MSQNGELWVQYAQSHDPDLREKLVLEHAGLVRYTVGRLNMTLPPSLDEQDLIGYGMIGLMDAVDHFDAGRGLAFSTYAFTRIRGHILDALRAADLLPRSARRQARLITKAIAQLQRQLLREPSDDELAAHLGLTMEQTLQAMQDASFAVLSLDTPTGFDDQGEPAGGSLGDILTDDSNAVRFDRLERVELRHRLMDCIRSLPEREKLVITLYYYEELTMKEVAQVMGVSESRVCQIHSKAILVLRAALVDEF
jgi:RNA polymerase sigma factor for flagellar operon FliA